MNGLKVVNFDFRYKKSGLKTAGITSYVLVTPGAMQHDLFGPSGPAELVSELAIINIILRNTPLAPRVQ